MVRRWWVLGVLGLVLGCDGVQVGLGAGKESSDSRAAGGEGVGRVQGEGQFQCGGSAGFSLTLGQIVAGTFAEFPEGQRTALHVGGEQARRLEVAVRLEGRITPLETVGVGLVRTSDGRIMGMGTQYRPLLTCVDAAWTLPPVILELEEGVDGFDLAAEVFELVGEFRFIDGDGGPRDVVVNYEAVLSTEGGTGG